MGCQESKAPQAATAKPQEMARTASAQAQLTLLQNSGVNGDKQKLAANQSPESSTATVSPNGARRCIKVQLANKEAMEVAVEPRDRVRHLCRRIADAKDAGWVTLLLDDEPLKEVLLVSSIPENEILTAVLLNSWDRPDRFSQTVKQQIRLSLEMNHARCPEEAFQEPTWAGFIELCEPIQDFHIFGFEFAGKQFIRFDFGMGGDGYGSLHAVGIVDPIMRFDCGKWVVESCTSMVEEWMDAHDHVGQEEQTYFDKERYRYYGSSPFFKALARAESARKDLGGSL